MAYIALMINLTNDYLSTHVQNFEKEIAERFVEKVKFTFFFFQIIK